MSACKQGMDLLEVARATGLRQHLHGVNANDARTMLGRFVAALSTPQVSGGGEVAVERVAWHIGKAVEYIEKMYPGAKMLDRGPIIRNMRRWHEQLTAAMSTPQARPDDGEADDDARRADLRIAIGEAANLDDAVERALIVTGAADSDGDHPAPQTDVARLVERWERRARGSHPSDAMLINLHVRELREAFTDAKPEADR